MRKFLYLPVENQNRELDGKFLLACFAAEKGYNVILGHDVKIFQYTSQPREVTGFPKGVMLYNGLSGNEYHSLWRIKNNGFQLFIQWEEELPFSQRLDEEIPRVKITRETSNLPLKICMWGNAGKNALAKKYPQIMNSTHVTGSPRMDPLRNIFRNNYAQLIKKRQQNIGKYILFPASIGNLDKKSLMSTLKSVFFHSPELNTQAYVNDCLARQEQSVEQTRKVLRLVAQSFPSLTLLIRPHPIGTTESWRKLFPEQKNIHITKEKTIGSWIMGSETFFHTGCTSSFEGLTLGHPQVDFRPEEIPTSGLVPVLSSATARTTDELLEKLEQCLAWDKSQPFPGDTKRAKEVFDNIGGPPACSRIIALLDSLDWKREVEYAEPIPKADVPPPPKIEGTYLHHNWKYQGVTTQELMEMLYGYQREVDLFKRIDIRSIAPEMFLIKRT